MVHVAMHSQHVPIHTKRRMFVYIFHFLCYRWDVDVMHHIIL